MPSGKTTNEDWNCQGIYLPTGLNNDGLPVAVKLVTGTELVAKSNPETGAVELNIPAVKVFKTGEVNWAIPDNAETLAAMQSSPGNGWKLGLAFAIIGMLTVWLSTHHYFAVRHDIDADTFDPPDRWVVLFSLAITLIGAGVIYYVFAAPLEQMGLLIPD